MTEVTERRINDLFACIKWAGMGAMSSMTVVNAFFSPRESILWGTALIGAALAGWYFRPLEATRS